MGHASTKMVNNSNSVKKRKELDKGYKAKQAERAKRTEGVTSNWQNKGLPKKGMLSRFFSSSKSKPVDKFDGVQDSPPRHDLSATTKEKQQKQTQQQPTVARKIPQLEVQKNLAKIASKREKKAEAERKNSPPSGGMFSSVTKQPEGGKVRRGSGGDAGVAARRSLHEVLAKNKR